MIKSQLSLHNSCQITSDTSAHYNRQQMSSAFELDIKIYYVLNCEMWT